MDPIGTFSGLASGIEWRDMVDQMMQIEISRRITPVQTQVDTAEARKEAWNSFSGLLSKFRTSAQSLRSGSPFGSMQTSVGNSPTSGNPLFTATPSSTSAPGSYKIEVLGLARADKLSGAAVTSATTALGFAGEFYLNGRKVDVSATDTLASIRDKVNGLNAGTSATGVSATILSTAPDEFRLILTSDATGSRGIQLTDGDSGVLQSLGMTTGALAQNTKPGEAGSVQTQRMSSASSALAAALGVTAPPAITTIDVDGQKITVDLMTDTMLTLMNRINAAGGSASIETEEVGGKSMQRLTVAGTVTADAAAGDPAASQRTIELLGFETAVRASPITAGQDASIRVDGFDVARRTNVIGDVIEGVTLNLQVAEPGSEIDVVVSRDLSAVVEAAEGMASAYNEMRKFVENQRSTNGPLATNGSLRATMYSISRTMLGGVSAIPASNPYTHASLAGIEFTKEGNLQVDAAKLTAALETNLADVRAMLTENGAVSDGEVTFVGSAPESVSGSYAIDITAPATQATGIGAAWADPNAYAAGDGVSDTLSITDSVTGKIIDYVVAQGRTLNEVVAELNSRFESEGVQLNAVAENGALRISADEYGSIAGFTIGGTAAAVLGLAETDYAGTDVEGTIGGLPATGVGQVLTGAAGEATEGIGIRYSGSVARAAGDVEYILGFGGMLDNTIEPSIRLNDGIIPTQVGALDRSIESLNKRMDAIEVRLEVRRQALIKSFTRMEAAMSQLQSQSSWLTSQIASLPGASSGSK